MVFEGRYTLCSVGLTAVFCNFFAGRNPVTTTTITTCGRQHQTPASLPECPPTRLPLLSHRKLTATPPNSPLLHLHLPSTSLRQTQHLVRTLQQSNFLHRQSKFGCLSAFISNVCVFGVILLLLCLPPHPKYFYLLIFFFTSPTLSSGNQIHFLFFR